MSLRKDITLLSSFVGKTGRFFVRRNEGLALDPKYAVYTNVDAYNTRSEVPIYIVAEEALSDFDYEVKIYPESLTTTPPAYAADRDESDYGLTPERNLWRNRFNQAKEGRRHAA